MRERLLNQLNLTRRLQMLFVSLAMLLPIKTWGQTNYGITITAPSGSYPVTSVTRTNVLNDSEGEETVQFDGVKTLILNNASLTSITIADQHEISELVIYLKGSNTILNNDRNGIIYGGGSKLPLTFATGDGSSEDCQPGTLELTYEVEDWEHPEDMNIYEHFSSVAYNNHLTAIQYTDDHKINLSVPIPPIVNKQNTEQINGEGTGLGEEIKDYIDNNLSGKSPFQVIDAFGQGITINKILYVLPHNDDGYEVVGSSNVLDLNSQMSDGSVEGVAQMLYDGDITPVSEDFKTFFHGLCYLLPAGEGKVVLDVNTGTKGELHVMVGIEEPVAIKGKTEFTTVEIPYDVQNETYVLVYSTVNPSSDYISQGTYGKTTPTTTQIRGLGAIATSISSEPEPPLTPKTLTKSDMVAPNVVDGDYASNYKIGKVVDSDVTAIADDAFEGLDVTCMDLSETSITGLTVDRDEYPWNRLPYSAFIYLPAGNKVKEGQQNVVIGGVCGNAELLEDNPFEVTKDFKAKEIELKRDFSGEIGKKCSIILPFALDATTAASLGTFHEMIDGGAGDESDGKVHMQKVTETEANVPYMFEPADIRFIDLESVKVEAATSSPEYTIQGMTFKGCFQKTPIESNSGSSYFCFINDQFVRVVDNSVDVKPFRAYMTADTSEHSYANIVDVDWDDETTSIKDMEAEANADNVYYDLQGRPVLNPQKGIYIVNGKKVVIK